MRLPAELDAGFSGPNRIANGGYCVSVALRAAERFTRGGELVACAAAFASRASPGPVELDCHSIGQGRKSSVVETSMHQDGREVLAVLTTFGASGDGHRVDGPKLAAPNLPDPDDCLDLAPAEAFPDVPIARRFEYRVARLPGWRSGRPAGVPKLEFWLRPADGSAVDSTGLATVADAGERAVFELGVFASLTLQLTLYVRGCPAPGWLACRVATRHVAGGHYEEDAEIWDSTGRLVAQSRQLALLPD